ncbi:MAG: response regulator [Alphaproteobacteria bacterium]|nr:response regulator [Alphaproteobacteria bacterium]
MALFGAPLSSEDDADKAVAVACEMIVSLQKLNEVRSLKDLEAIEIGIGVSTGDVVAGSVGSEKRMEYTVIGDSVNLAARLESANKFYGTNVLISEHTVPDLTRETPLREIDLIRVKGQDQPIAVYEALAHQLPETLVKIQPAVEIYAGALALYRARDWNGAQRAFEAVLEMCPGDGPSRIHIERCTEYSTPPRQKLGMASGRCLKSNNWGYPLSCPSGRTKRKFSMAKKSILVIDDQQNLRDLIEYQLTIVDGHTVVMAGDGKKGLKIAQRTKPDLVLLDWMLPGMDGMEVLENLLTTPATQNIPVYMMTVRGKMRDVEIALGAGALDYVTKPIDVQELSRKVSRAFTLSDSSANSSNT